MILIYRVISALIVGVAAMEIIPLIEHNSAFPGGKKTLWLIVVVVATLFAAYITDIFEIISGKLKNKRSYTPPNPVPADAPTRHGKVRWFNTKRGYGFITQDDGTDLFVHSRSVEGNKFNEGLEENQKVSFFVTTSSKGSEAVNVKVQSS